MKVEFTLPHSFWKVLLLRCKEYEKTSGKKYDVNDLCRDLSINYVQAQPEYKKALEILGKNKDKFEV